MEHLPDLRVKNNKVENQVRFDLRRFLYVAPQTRSGRVWSAKWFVPKIYRENLEPEKLERLSLLIELKEFFENRLTAGYPLSSQETYLDKLQHFFRYFDLNGKPVTLDTLGKAYYEYCEHLFQLCNQKPPALKQYTAYQYGAALSAIFSEILGLPSKSDLIFRTRLRHPKQIKTAVGTEVEKQNLEDTRKIGSFLVDITSGITVDAVLGRLPIRIPVQAGIVENDEIILSMQERSDTVSDLLSRQFESLTAVEKKAVRQVHYRQQAVHSIEGTARWWFVNIRIIAEFMIFIAQTGMNVTQAMKLNRKNFKYKSQGENWQVTAYKRRRGGEVTFPIYKSYKKHLQEQLSFINYFFPDSELLFPHFNGRGELSDAENFLYTPIQKLLKEHGLPWVSPRTLRKTRENWILRRSGDAELTADMHQHHVETLHKDYELPSQQRAGAEITRFWHHHDPIERDNLKSSVILGQCSGDPVPTEDKPASVVAPNCINPAGCLWCKHLRDIDTQDYVWSLASFRHLKSIESAGVITREVNPADLTIERLTEKISWFREQGGHRYNWVEEAEMRISEGDYHPHWAGILEFIEE